MQRLIRHYLPIKLLEYRHTDTMPGANKLVWSAENEQKLLLAIYVTHNIDFHKVAVVFGTMQLPVHKK